MLRRTFLTLLASAPVLGRLVAKKSQGEEITIVNVDPHNALTLVHEDADLEALTMHFASASPKDGSAVKFSQAILIEPGKWTVLG